MLLLSNDELTKYSLIELIRNRIEDELAGNIELIDNLGIEQRDNDLILRLWLK